MNAYAVKGRKEMAEKKNLLTLEGLKKLEDDGYIKQYDGRILLTEKGKEIARKTYDKHSFFKQWLIMAGVDDKVAEEEACQMEHIISEDSFDKITAYLKKFDDRFGQ